MTVSRPAVVVAVVVTWLFSGWALVVHRPAPAAPAVRTSATSMPAYCEGQVRVFPGLGVAYDPTCQPAGP